ncbi:MAG: hypothetical protein ACRD0D_04485 [Acidimicrobiales bacterium]
MARPGHSWYPPIGWARQVGLAVGMPSWRAATVIVVGHHLPHVAAELLRGREMDRVERSQVLGHQPSRRAEHAVVCGVERGYE